MCRSAFRVSTRNTNKGLLLRSGILQVGLALLIVCHFICFPNYSPAAPLGGRPGTWVPAIQEKLV